MSGSCDLNKNARAAVDERELVKLLQKCPEQGLALAIDAYGGLVEAVLWRTLGGAAAGDVEECLADVFVRLYQSIDRFDPQSGYTLKSYLCGIARHTALDRRRKLQQLPSFIPLDLVELGLGDEPALRLAEQQTAALVQEAVDGLPAPDREIFIRRYYFGEKLADIAAHLGLDYKSVENRLYRGKQRLRVLLTERGVER